jgi:hypothetical protein
MNEKEKDRGMKRTTKKESLTTTRGGRPEKNAILQSVFADSFAG